jgi:hypothetical protein
MKKLFVMSLCIIISSCFKTEIVQYGTANTDPVIFASGQQLPTASRNYTNFCNPNGWGRKLCKFLSKYDDTIWADAENYYSDFSDIKFSNFKDGPYFISFFNIDNTASYCDGWKLGETTYDGIKWNIRFKKDELDLLWFDYDYYGFSQEIEYTITYKYEVIDGLLHFSRNKLEKNNSEDLVDTSEIDQTFIFSPSEKNYSKDLVDTGQIILSEGCMFY